MGASRVVITGLGAVTPLGMTVEKTWQGLTEGRCGVDTIKAFDPVGFTCRIAGEVDEYRIRDFVPKSHRKATKLMSRDIELSVIAAAEAIADAGIITKATDPDAVNVDPTRMAINLGAGLISCDLVELAPAVAASVTDGRFDIKKWGSDGLNLVTPLWLLKYLPNMLPCHIGIIHDIQGPSNTITCAEASAHLAIAEAAQVLERGSADLAVCGGAEAKVNPIVMIRQCLTGRATIQGNDNPAGACRPFDTAASGSVFGEAAGIIVIETLEHATSRGARIYAELLGSGQSTNVCKKYEKLESDGCGIKVAVEKALADAGITADDLDLVIPHGTGIPDDDRAEATALKAALGPAAEKIVFWPTKSMLSNTGAASGGVDVIAAVKAISSGLIPAAQNFETPAEGCDLNIPGQPINSKPKHVLCCSYTYGGQTAAVVLRQFDNQVDG